MPVVLELLFLWCFFLPLVVPVLEADVSVELEFVPALVSVEDDFLW